MAHVSQKRGAFRPFLWSAWFSHLTRNTYESADGTRAAVGVEAIGRALEHIHLGWALLGFLLRLPVLRQVSQLLVDASGGEARRISANGRDETARPPAACRYD